MHNRAGSNRVAVITIAVLSALASISLADLPKTQPEGARPTSRPGPPAPYLIGAMHVQTLPSIHYFFASEQTTIAQVARVAPRILTELARAHREGKIRRLGPELFVFHGIDPADLSKPFTLDIGVPVEEGTPTFGDFHVRRTEVFHCATVLYTGPIAEIGNAYEKLGPAIRAAGLAPTGQSREAYLYWEGPDSANNVVQIQMEIR
jgi:effector-binding domain-containing protein